MRRNRSTRNPKLTRFVLVLAAVVALSSGYYFGNKTQTTSAPQTLTKLQLATKLGDGRPLLPFQLATLEDDSFDMDDLRGKWSFLYFGYTYCPDICPESLTKMVLMQNRLVAYPELNEQVQFVMISVDPARDTLEHLHRYVTHFHPDFIGATGSAEALAEMAADIGIFYKIHEPDANGNYPVDHGSSMIVIDPRGHIIALYPAIHDPKIAVEDFLQIAGH